MQTRFNAYLTVYLSLIFGIVLSLLFVLIEGAAICATRAQAELVADLGLDSVFAEYNRELLEQYEVFFIDSSYGGRTGGIGMLEQHLSQYMSYNMNPEQDLLLAGETTLLKLRNPYLEIAEVSCASDENCMVWKAQAVGHMKAVYGGDLISRVQEHMDTVKNNGLDSTDALGQIEAQKQGLEEALQEKEIVEYGAESEEGYSYQKVQGVFDGIIGSGILAWVLPDGASVSQAAADAGPYFSARRKNGKINQGSGLHEGVDRPDSLVDELIYGAYLMKQCGNYRAPKSQGLLQYQTEYILYGYKSDAENLRACAERLFALRAASNLMAVYGDSGKRQRRSWCQPSSVRCCSPLSSQTRSRQSSLGRGRLQRLRWMCVFCLTAQKCRLSKNRGTGISVCLIFSLGISLAMVKQRLDCLIRTIWEFFWG